MIHRMFIQRLLAVAASVAAGGVMALTAPAAAQASQAGPVTATQHKSAAAPAKALPSRQETSASNGDARRSCAATARPGYATCFAMYRTNVKPRKGILADSAPSGYGPSDLHSAYNLPSATAGNGQTVALVDAYDNPGAEADLAVYRQQYGLPPCTTANGCFEKVNQKGQQYGYPAANSSWAEEESLDVDMVSAACPNCHIILIEASSTSFKNLGTAVNEAVAMGAKYVSNSYGTSYTNKPGSGESPNELAWDARYYNHPGVAVTASAGDSGYGVHYPAVSQYVTAVGGTSLTQDSTVPRGWTEAVWDNSSGGPGSGCSKFEPKPAWQRDSGCANRTVADVSADADPNTGVAVYDSSIGGWHVFGGTSVASPLIAATYALAGTPVGGTYPSSYPYADPAALNDITAGNNGTCTPLYLCSAGPGYDGPTGLGTPDGVAAFTAGPRGDLAGQVTSAATGKPVTGATVTADGTSVTTDSQGDYDLPLPAGSYTVTTGAYAYNPATSNSVAITQGATTTQNVALTPQPAVTINGKITDGSGQGWPLYAKITASGVPGTVYTSPYTGRYTLTVLPSQAYTVRIASVSPGYPTVTRKITVGTSTVRKNIALPTDLTPDVGCTAPGYQTAGTTEQFTAWTGSTPQDGWTVTDNNGSGQTWVFGNDPTREGEPPGSDGQFAIADSNYYSNSPIDTSLTSPVENLSSVASPGIAFNTWFWSGGAAAEVDLSLDGGTTWTTVWLQTAGTVEGTVDIPIPQAAGQSDVQIRFTYNTGTTSDDWWWSLDNVLIGGCTPVPGGLVAGTVTDANTGQGIAGATVTGTGDPPQTATTAVTPEAGLYELFSPATGKQQLTATDTNNYQAQPKTIAVTTGNVTKADFRLQAGDLSLSPGSLSSTVLLGKSATQDLRVTNTGTVAASFTIAAQDGGFTSLTQPATKATARRAEPAGSTGTSWLSASPAQGQVAPGGSVTVAVTLASGGTDAGQPGTYTAQLVLSTDTPYTPAAAVTMTVTPSKTWGEITGTVSGAACNGSTAPIAGSTVEITSWASDYSLTTDAGGGYVWWLNKNNNPLTVIASMDGWQPQQQKVKITAGQAATVNFTLQPAQACNSKRR